MALGSLFWIVFMLGVCVVRPLPHAPRPPPLPPHVHPPREADAIRALLRRLRRADRLERVQITGRLRRVYGFWISDWRGVLPWTVLASPTLTSMRWWRGGTSRSGRIEAGTGSSQV